MIGYVGCQYTRNIKQYYNSYYLISQYQPAQTTFLPQWEQGTVSGRHGRSSPSPEGTPVMFADRYMEKHITPVTFNPNVKRNPLYTDTRPQEREDPEPYKPSWTIKEYDQHSVHGQLAASMMVPWRRKAIDSGCDWLDSTKYDWCVETGGWLLIDAWPTPETPLHIC